MAVRAELIQFDDVPENGVLDDGEQVPVDGRTFQSAPDGGCGTPDCPCTKALIYQRIFPRDDRGVVFGYTVEFDSPEEMAGLTEQDFARLAQQAMH
ncbi:hypothetical protein [Paraburkholderia sp. SIMBA_054]|uniref:hypothetical protein n=1 Tax=Paraburkholderia sp. SIMBA_054 TaxID=3085795 RepID=UPI0039780B52